MKAHAVKLTGYKALRGKDAFPALGKGEYVVVQTQQSLCGVDVHWSRISHVGSIITCKTCLKMLGADKERGRTMSITVSEVPKTIITYRAVVTCDNKDCSHFATFTGVTMKDLERNAAIRDWLWIHGPTEDVFACPSCRP